MALDQIQNFVRGELSESIDSEQTSIDVEDGSIFPSPPAEYNLVIYDAGNFSRASKDPNVEIVRVTDVADNTLTVERGQENTDASNHPSSAEIFLSVTSKMFTDIGQTFATENDLEGLGQDSRRSINQLFIQTARHDFELGLAKLNYDDGQYQIFADGTRIAEQQNLDINFGSPTNDAGFARLETGEITGQVTHVTQDMRFVPSEAVVIDELYEDLPENTNIEYEIEDDNGNIVTVQRTNLDRAISLEEIETLRVKTRAVLSRNSTDDERPALDAYSVYLSGSEPSEYIELTDQGLEVN